MKSLTLKEKIDAVNALLEKGEPDNIETYSYGPQTFTGYKIQSVNDAMCEVLGADGWMVHTTNFSVDKIDKPTEMIADVNIMLKDDAGKYFQLSSSSGGAKIRGSVADARKAAVSDATKKALGIKQFGKKAFQGLLEIPQSFKKKDFKVASLKTASVSDFKSKKITKLNEIRDLAVKFIKEDLITQDDAVKATEDILGDKAIDLETLQELAMIQSKLKLMANKTGGEAA